MSDEHLDDKGQPGQEGQPADNPPPGTDADSWLGALPEELKGLAEVKGWKDPADALKSYKYLEEFMGADKAGRGVVLPRDNEDQEAFDRIYKAMGRPDEPAGYELDKVLEGESVDGDFMGLMSEAMHQAGLSKSQSTSMAKAWQGYYNQVMEQARQSRDAEVEEVEKQCSPADLAIYRQGIALAADGDRELMRRIEQQLGPKMGMEIFKRIGEALGEDKMAAAAEGVGSGSSFGAKQRIAELKSDPHFLKRYLDGDQAAKNQMEALYKQAYPDDK